jgi:ABC-type branched-subunit amino acid transport system ATPase component
MTTAGSVLSLDGVSVGYLPGVPVLEDVGLEVRTGDALGIIGRNGAGKTCLAMTLMGVLPGQGGTVTLGGRDLASLPPGGRVRQRLALVPEGRQVFGQLSVRENLVVAAYGVGKRLSNREFGRITEMFPVLRKKETHLSASLSGGEQQMLAIARALVQDPAVIVFDEPSLGLAPIAIDSLSVTLAGIRDSGVGLLLMEQNRGLLEDLCSSVLLLDAGRVARPLRPDELSEPDVMAAYLGHAGSANAL